MREPTCHVLVDGRSLFDSSAYRGLGGYTREVCRGLARLPDLALSALVTRGTALPPGVRPVHVRRLAPGRYQDREHELLLPLDLLRDRSDVLWLPANVPPARCKRPWVQSLHDLLPLSGEDREAAARFRRRAERYRHATQIITGSTWAAGEIEAELGIDASRIHVIPHGVAAHFRPRPTTQEEPPYLLFVGEYDPRKRHSVAYEAIGALADRGLPHTLKVTGRIAPWFADTMTDLRSQAPHPERVELLGHVSVQQLVALYQGASALLHTSEAEGFGLPAAEAMACGTPVVGFANSATTDVVGAGGLLVADGDFDALVAALLAVVTEPARRSALSKAALARAEAFTWEQSAREHARVLMLAAS